MSEDGAQLGVDAKRALNTVLGGAPQPSDEERMSAEQMRAEILATTEDPNTYDGTATYAAHLVLKWLIEDSSRAQGPVENVYAKLPDGKTDYGNVAEPGWYDRMKADGIALDKLGLTGFMWGWAVNAPRRCVELPAVPNPAIMTIGASE